MQLGSNFIRPAVIELEVAEQLLHLRRTAWRWRSSLRTALMRTTCRSSWRAGTPGGDMVAVCGDHPFFSVDDWFMGTTAIERRHSRKRSGSSLSSSATTTSGACRRSSDQYPGRLACHLPRAGEGQGAARALLARGAGLCATSTEPIFVLDEMITGFRWHVGGGQGYHDVVPDLSCWGKGLGNGFSAFSPAGRQARDHGAWWPSARTGTRCSSYRRRTEQRPTPWPPR